MQADRSGLKIKQMPSNITHISKFLSFVLRHKPESIGLSLDRQGWASVDELIAKSKTHGNIFSREVLIQAVERDEKRRFSLSEDRQRIRAAQGHSVSVELGLVPQIPPDILYHGTATRFVESILAEGLKPQSRQQVHLSIDLLTALKVGKRHGKPIVFEVNTARMLEQGFKFFLADNGVWLTDCVPSSFLTLSSKNLADS